MSTAYLNSHGLREPARPLLRCAASSNPVTFRAEGKTKKVEAPGNAKGSSQVEDLGNERDFVVVVYDRRRPTERTAWMN